MSGGYFEHRQYNIQYIIDEIEHLIEKNGSKERDDYGYLKYSDYSEETIREFKKAIELLKKGHVYAQRIDWLVSGDDGETTFHNRLNDELNKIEEEDDED